VRNVWKGMVIGALTGAATGLALDLGERGAAGAAALGGAAVDHAPEVAGHVRQAVSDALATAGEHHRLSEVPAKARSTTTAAQEKVSAAVAEGRERATDAVGLGRDLLVGSVGRVRDAADHS